MSDISDVSNALVAAVFNAVYPPVTFDQDGETLDSKLTFDETSTAPVAAHKFNDGTQYNTGARYDEKKSPSVSGTPIVIYPGWPSEDNLAKDLAAGKTHITVFPKAEERNTTRYPEREIVTIRPAPTLTLAISGPFLQADAILFDTPGVTLDQSGVVFDRDIARTINVTIGGTVKVPQNLALRINNRFYVYAVQKSDTLTTIAAALAALVAVNVAGTSATGPVITIGPTGRLQAARVGGFGTVATEVRRQERVMQISVWTNSPSLRDVISSAVDVALAQIRFLTLPDGFGGGLIYKNSMVIDNLQKDALYRRDLNYLVEYPTTVSEQRAAVVAPYAQSE